MVAFELMLDALARSRREQTILWWGEDNYYLICRRPTHLVGFLWCLLTDTGHGKTCRSTQTKYPQSECLADIQQIQIQ